MKPLPGWPDGVMALINHPVRTGGWHPFFSECPNDSRYFAMDVLSPADLHRLVKALAAVQSDEVVVALSPEEAARHADGAGAVFSLGNQPAIDAWFKRLPVVEPGVRQFGVHRYTEPPRARPPTLTIYVGHPACDPRKLRFPKKLTVRDAIAQAHHAKFPSECRAIEKLVALHKARAEKTP